MKTSKRYVKFLSLIFILKCLSKFNLIRILKRDDKLHSFRRLEDCSKKQVKCDGAIEFLHLCQNFELTPTFANVDQTKSNKWPKSSQEFIANVIKEELGSKFKQKAALKDEINAMYDEIRQKYSLLQYMCIVRTMVNLRKKHYETVMAKHANKITRLLNKDQDVYKHIQNISSHKLSFFQKLVLCQGLKFSLPQRISAIDVQASFEKLYWKLERTLSDDKKELTAATLRSIALNYI